MLYINESYAEGLRESLQGFVRFEGRHPSDEELEFILWEEFEVVVTYDEDLVGIWKELGYPDLSILKGYASIKDAIRGVVSEMWHTELMPQARKYLGWL